MALVSYEASDSESITDEESEDNSGTVETTAKRAEEVQNGSDIFHKLPVPKSVNLIDIKEENDEFLLKKEVPTDKPNIKKPIRIHAPSLNDFGSDDDEPKEKKPKMISKSSGLFSILPPPKTLSATTKSFIPNSVQKKAKPIPPKPATASSLKAFASQKVTVQKVSPIRESTTDDEDEDMVVEQFDVNTWKKVCGRKTKSRSDPIIEIIDQSESGHVIDINTAPEPARPYDGLDNEAFKKLVGSSRMRTENIKLIDINEEEVLTEETILRTKALTDPEIETRSEEEPVSCMSKRKHHITYLAQQAKANEQDLKNRWASNRYSRKQTQAKYGF